VGARFDVARDTSLHRVARRANFLGQIPGSARHQDCNPGQSRNRVPENLQPFTRNVGGQTAEAGHITAWSRQALHEAADERVSSPRHDDRNGRSHRPRGTNGESLPVRATNGTMARGG